MKKPFFALSALVGLLGLFVPRAARAQVDSIIEADIPFAFHAGEAQMPPGKYRLYSPEDSYGRVMEIRSVEGSQAALLEVFGTQAQKPAPDSELVFHKYGDNYYLWRIVESGSVGGDQVPVSRSERNLRQELSLGERQAEARVPARSRAS
jgi:hypothetical protein